MIVCGEWGPSGPTVEQEYIIENLWFNTIWPTPVFTEEMSNWFMTNIRNRYWFIRDYKIICFENLADAALFKLTWQ